MNTTTTTRAFDPTTDPFDPREEGWGGWEEWHLPIESGYQYDHIHAQFNVSSGVGVNGSWFVIEDKDEGEIYDGLPLPHNIVVGILLANGYTPETA